MVRTIGHDRQLDTRTRVARRAAGLGLVLLLLGAEASSEGPLALADPVDVDWKMLSGLDYRTGDMTDELRKLGGEYVRIAGYMVPLDDFADGVTEFLLVPYVGACIHTPPPPPNQIVYVPMERGQMVNVEWWDPIWVHGFLEISSVKSAYGVVGFQLLGDQVEPYHY